MRVLVLGGDGFIGSHFVDQAFTLGHEVTVFDRFPYQVSNNLEHQRGNINFISGEFDNRDDISKALAGIDIVYHFISLTTPADSWNDPLIEIENNLRSSVQFFELASIQGIRKIVYPSSGGTVYGPQHKAINENTLPRPLSPYGITKLAIEHFLHYYKEHSGIEIDIYRIGNAYGPRQPIQRKQGVIAVWMQNILDGAEIQVYGDITTLRDYVYIEDISFLMTHSLRNIASSNIYNLGTGVGTSIIRLLEIFKTVIDNPIRYQIHPRRPLDNASIVLDSTRLLVQFPHFQFQKLEDKISETWDNFMSRQ